MTDTTTKADPWTFTVSFGDGADDDTVRLLLGEAVNREYIVTLSFTGPGDDVVARLKRLRWHDEQTGLGLEFRKFDEDAGEETGPDIWVPLDVVAGIQF